MIRVALADDHAVVRRGLEEILRAEPDMEVGGVAADGAELLDLVRRRSFDVVLLDITMPGQSGLEIIRSLKQERPGMPVLVLTMHAEDQFGVRAMRAGAAGYLTKESAPDEMVRAIRRVVAGGKHIGPSLAEHLAEAVTADQTRLPHQRLSDREFHVLRELVTGKRVGEIARDLALSVKTVSTYRARVLRKMQLKNSVELTQYAIRHRLVE